MKPFIKWPGGKACEFKIISTKLPSSINNYYEPFVGGGAVYLALDSDNIKKYYLNDKSLELITLYKEIQLENAEFFYAIKEINKCWKILETVTDNYIGELSFLYEEYRFNRISYSNLEKEITMFIICNEKQFNGILNKSFIVSKEKVLDYLKENLISKFKRMKKIEKEKGLLTHKDIQVNIETSLKSGLYMHFRYLYNNSSSLNLNPHFVSALFYFIREYCYSSMFRYNNYGEFNVPYGGISYNHKYLSHKIECMQSEYLKKKLNKTDIFSLDFDDFFHQCRPSSGDFVFLDPPYDTNFSTYANNFFGKEDHYRLANFCYKTNANFMLVIKNTEFIFNLYKDFNVVSFDKRYTVSFQNRNSKEAEHLIITNYKIGEE